MYLMQPSNTDKKNFIFFLGLFLTNYSDYISQIHGNENYKVFRYVPGMTSGAVKG